MVKRDEGIRQIRTEESLYHIPFYIVFILIYVNMFHTKLVKGDKIFAFVRKITYFKI